MLPKNLCSFSRKFVIQLKCLNILVVFSVRNFYLCLQLKVGSKLTQERKKNLKQIIMLLREPTASCLCVCNTDSVIIVILQRKKIFIFIS